LGFAIELYFDEDLEAQLKAVRSRLSESGLGDDLEALGMAPHLTLGMCQQLDLETFRPQLQQRVSESLPLPISLGSVGLFPGDVLFFAPIITRALLVLHHDVWKLLEGSGTECAPLYEPGRWVPHCTMTMNVRPDERMAALEAIMTASLPMKGQITSVGVSVVQPTATRMRVLLS